MSELSNGVDRSTLSVRLGSVRRYLPKGAFNALVDSCIPCEMCLPDGSIESFGKEAPEFRITLRNTEALVAVASLNEMRIAESYLNNNIDLDGNLLKLFELRRILVDSSPMVSIWRFLEPLIFGQIKTNKRAVFSHYNVDADFFMTFLDKTTPSYTQGIYVHDEETLETATIRKFDYCYQALDLKPGDHILDIGPGWGAWLEYASAQGVMCTGITISQASVDYLRQRAAILGYDWNIVFSDLLEYNPKEKYDAIVIMGVIEHLPQYDLVVAKFQSWIKPGGRIFLDGSADTRKYDVSNFIVKYIYPGNHSYLVLHDFLRALSTTPLRLTELYNDRHSYYLSARQWARNLDTNQQIVRDRFGENAYRRFRLYLWGTAYQFLSGGLDCYRMVIHNPVKK